jgi:hypothetical protein
MPYGICGEGEFVKETAEKTINKFVAKAVDD